jgi:phage terminase large subunit GpA-like protein
MRSVSEDLLDDLADGAAVVRSTCLAGLMPDPIISVAEWAEEHRMLPTKTTAIGGHYRIEKTPWVREILEKLSPDDPTREVWWQKGHQIGGSTVGENWIGFLAANAGGPTLAVRPTLDKAKEWTRERIQPMFDECPCFIGRVAEQRSRDGGNAILYKDYVGGYLRIVGANVPSPLKSSSIKNGLLDEMDDMPWDVGGQGDVVELLRARLTTFGKSAKLYGNGTPTVAGYSQIAKQFNDTNQKYWHVPCIRCGEYHPILWRHIVWDEGDPSSARFHCPSCDHEFEEYHKPRICAAGRWIATAEGKRPLVEGYHTSALYSPPDWLSWEECARRLSTAKRRGPQAMKVWVNTILGEVSDAAADGAEADPLFARREVYGSEVPEGVLVLVAGVDIQQDRAELVVDGYGIGEESWRIDRRVVHGNPLETELWKSLDDVLLTKRYRHTHGDLMPISAVAIDSGYAARQVYAYVERRGARNIFAIKGRSGSSVQMLEPPQRKRRGDDPRKVDVHILGVDSIKALIYSRLRLLERGPGFCHFPATEAFDTEYFQQLCAEKRLLRHRKGFPVLEWVVTRPGGRNEALDATVYAYGALLMLNPVWAALEKRRAAIKARLSGGEPTTKVVTDPGPRQAPAQGHTTSFVNRYRRGRS